MEMEVVVETSAGVMVPEKRWENQPTSNVPYSMSGIYMINSIQAGTMGNLILSTIALLFELLT